MLEITDHTTPLVSPLRDYAPMRRRSYDSAPPDRRVNRGAQMCASCRAQLERGGMAVCGCILFSPVIT